MADCFSTNVLDGFLRGCVIARWIIESAGQFGMDNLNVARNTFLTCQPVREKPASWFEV